MLKVSATTRAHGAAGVAPIAGLIEPRGLAPGDVAVLLHDTELAEKIPLAVTRETLSRSPRQI
jgi:hypothetical protein